MAKADEGGVLVDDNKVSKVHARRRFIEKRDQKKLLQTRAFPGNTQGSMSAFSDAVTDGGFDIKPVVVMVIAVSFIVSVVTLHISARILKSFSA